MVADLVLAVDASTTAVKAIAFDAVGAVVAEGRAPVALDNPEPHGWEQDAEAWWTALGLACRAVVAQLDGQRLAAMCITHQRETVVLVDPRGEPLAPALVWMDKRCKPQVARAVAELGAQALHAISGKPACTTPSMYKVQYLLERHPELLERGARPLDVHAFLVWRLSGRYATSLAAADPTGLVDMQARAWSAPLVAWLGLDAGDLPELVEPGSLLGEVSASGAEAIGVPRGLPLVAGAGDGQSAGLGAGIVAPGRAYLNLGTAVVSGVLSKRYATDAAFRTLYAADGSGFFLETDLQGGTFTLTWLIDRLLRGAGVERSFDEVLCELDAGAARLGPGAEGLVLVPYLNGVMNPYWDDDASGVLAGLRGHHQAAHVFRAIVEGIAFEQRLHTRGVEAVVGEVSELVVMGGGSKSAMWCQILADVLGRPIQRAATSEATALGAAILAAPTSGMHPDVPAACGAMTRLAERFEPGDDAPRYDALYCEVYEGLYLDVQQRMQRLARLT